MEPVSGSVHGRALTPLAKAESDIGRRDGPDEGTVRRWTEDAQATILGHQGLNLDWWHCNQVWIPMKGLGYAYDELEGAFCGVKKDFFGQKQDVEPEQP